MNNIKFIIESAQIVKNTGFKMDFAYLTIVIIVLILCLFFYIAAECNV